MTDANRPTETVSDERLRELAVLAYLGLPDEFRKDVHSALTELQRLRSSGGASGCGHHGYISQSRALEMVAQLGDRKPTETGEYTMGWNTAIEFAVNVLKGIPSTAPEPRAALDELHQMDQDMLGKRSPEPSAGASERPAAAGAAFADEFKREPTSPSDCAWMNGYAAGRRAPEPSGKYAMMRRDELEASLDELAAEVERLRHYVATCGGTDNDGRCPMHHLAGVSPEPAAEPAISDNPSDKCCMDIYRSLDHDEAKRELRVIYVAWKRGQVLMCPSSTKSG